MKCVYDPEEQWQNPDTVSLIPDIHSKAKTLRKEQLAGILISFFNLPTLNSCSRKLKRLNSQDNSKAVKMGSFDDKAIKLGLAKAR